VAYGAKNDLFEPIVKRRFQTHYCTFFKVKIGVLLNCG